MGRSRTEQGLTVRAVVFGSMLSALLAAANAYLGLFAGMTVSASIPACVASLALLRLFRRGVCSATRIPLDPADAQKLILEANLIQTAASAGEALAAGVVFTFPALVIEGAWRDDGFLYFRTTALCLSGGILGVAFSVPLRRALVKDPRLSFPEGRATATVLKTGFPTAAQEKPPAVLRRHSPERSSLRSPQRAASQSPVRVSLDDTGTAELANNDTLFVSENPRSLSWSHDISRTTSDGSFPSSYSRSASRETRVAQSAAKTTTHGFRFILLGAIVGSVFKLGDSALRLWRAQVAFAFRLGHAVVFYSGFAISGSLIGVGYIVGLNISAVVATGGLINWWIVIPIVASGHPLSMEEMNVTGVPLPPGSDVHAPSAVDEAYMIWSELTRYLGVGSMLIGGVWTLVAIRSELWASAKTLGRSCTVGICRLLPLRVRPLFAGDHNALDSEDTDSDDVDADDIGGTGAEAHRVRDAAQGSSKELGGQWVLLAVLICSAPLAVIFSKFTGNFGVAAVMLVLALICGALFSAVGGYMAGLVGSSSNPISGITIATLAVTSVFMLLLVGSDKDSTRTFTGAGAAIMSSAAVACAAAISGDNMQDLKCGQLLSATPKYQQIMQVVGVLSAAVVMAPVLQLLDTAYGIGPNAGPNGLPAPQASLIAMLASAIFGTGRREVPWAIVITGMAIAVATIGLGFFLTKVVKSSRIRVPVLALAVGLYLPLELSATMFLGGVISHVGKKCRERMRRTKRAAGEQSALLRDPQLRSRSRPAKALPEVIEDDDEVDDDTQEAHDAAGLLFSAGLITGEALLGIALAVPIVISGDREVIAIFGVVDAVWPGPIMLTLLVGGFLVAQTGFGSRLRTPLLCS